jgi:hypothetical protein
MLTKKVDDEASFIFESGELRVVKLFEYFYGIC